MRSRHHPALPPEPQSLPPPPVSPQAAQVIPNPEPLASQIASGQLFNPVPQQALRQNVVAALLHAIFRGQLKEGDWLNAQKLADQFGVSATPVREALVELATIGIVENRHNRGTMVRSFGPVQLRDIYHLRRVLESEATRCACGRVPLELLEELKKLMTALLREHRKTGDWSARAMSSDCRLHGLIATHCGSQRLAEEIARYNTLIQCIRDVVGDQSYAQQRALPEHLEIIEALIRQDPDSAAAAMARHIQSSADTVQHALFSTAARKGTAAK